MKPHIALVRVTVALLLLWTRAAAAEEWRGARPGTTTLQEVMDSFGKPSGRTTAGKTLTLNYVRKAAPWGTRAVVFRFSSEDELLRRIEVTPKPAPARAALEEKFGPACQEDTPPETSCYELAATPLNQLAFRYRTRGLEVIFERRQVLSLAYTEPQRRPAPPPQAEARPEPREEPPASTASASTVHASGTVPIAQTEPVTPAEVSEASTATAASGTDSLMGMSPDSLMRPVTVDDSSTPSEPEKNVPDRMTVIDGDLTRESAESQPGDPLTLGGLYFQRAEMAGTRDLLKGTSSYQPVLPSLVDLFLDVKPSETTRGLIRGRLLFDPLDPALTTPSALLDQLWFQFNIAQRVFVSVGRQQIKWGSSRLWNTTDFLRQPNPRPFDAFDLRTGVDMLKVNIPWESLASNLWLITTVDLNGPESNRVRYGGAVRAEVAAGVGELALTAAFGQGRRPRYGADWSMGLGPLDFYAEAALVRDGDVRQWERTPGGFMQPAPHGPKLLASGGVSGTFRVADVWRTILRVEGFYNELGYEDGSMLTWVRSTGDYRALFFGRYYGMAQLTVSRRSQYEPNFTLTTVVNPLDRSGMGRFDAFVYALRDVVVLGFVEMPFGRRGTEFRFQPDPQVTPLARPGLLVFNTGLGVRIRM
jgi:hypothetical protein